MHGFVALFGPVQGATVPAGGAIDDETAGVSCDPLAGRGSGTHATQQVSSRKAAAIARKSSTHSCAPPAWLTSHGVAIPPTGTMACSQAIGVLELMTLASFSTY